MPPEYRRGQGPSALPQGAAAALNRAQPPPAEQVGALALENQEIPVEFAPGEGDLDDDGPAGSDDLEILLDSPDPGFQPAVVQRDRQGRVPSYVVRHLAQLRTAASAPGAPIALKAMYNATIRQLEAERRRR